MTRLVRYWSSIIIRILISFSEDVVDLSTNTNLESLVIFCLVGSPLHNYLQWIHALLSMITSKSLKTLHVNSTSQNILADLSDHDVCSHIDEVLATSPFSGLTKFELAFKLHYMGDSETADKVKAKVRALFPRAEARGVLHINVSKRRY